MNIVNYSSSDESENEDESNIYIPKKDSEENINKTLKLALPTPKNIVNINDPDPNTIQKLSPFDLPQPKVNVAIIAEEDKLPLPKKIDYGEIPKPPKNKKGVTRISIPSLKEFENLEIDEDENNGCMVKSSEQKKSGFLSALPPLKNSINTAKPISMVPNVLTKKPELKKTSTVKPVQKPVATKLAAEVKPVSPKLESLQKYSDSEDDEDQSSVTDFFSLSTPIKIPDELLAPVDSFISENTSSDISTRKINSDETLKKETNSPTNGKTLTSTVMNLPKEEILLKNKIEVGPKLPVPEQEYYVDPEGNLAFDDKAIEYLCGKRGVKRKKEFENVNMVEIKGDDIKPDERDWLVKGLTEEQVIRPVSANAGPSGQSKKKHQITYLAHQAKSMELELKNQWAQSRANRQASRSKYGF